MITSKSVASLNLEKPLIETNNPNQQSLTNLNPKELAVRYWVLLIVCYFKFVVYYTIESPASIKQEVLVHFKINNLEFGLFFTATSLLNIVLALFTGIFVDVVGIRTANMLFGVLFFIGQIIFSVSCYGETNYQLALVGRIILGISRFILVALCFVFNHIDKKYERQFNDSSVLQDNETIQINRSQNSEVQEKPTISMRLFKKLSKLFWIFMIANIISYMTLLPFHANISQLLRVKYGFDIIQTGNIMGYIAIFTTLMGPVLGAVSDKIDKRMQTLIFANMTIATVQSFFVLAPNFDKSYLIVIPITLFELSFGIFVSNLQAAMKQKYQSFNLIQ
ncbi:major facilitator superfamily protein [Stylonychia lemnae]|uniref:Lysosomal dipeptide transporter MFSD1 n=1 Tax=Stylonychia lemnae TaxID=5949 RepID=A0A078AUD8_STYLE|nr:major facilitator superfamily protein [Stylonychia lemnae]|eukprot:CDW85621.1 major facilitator superfamily protein [Stylonychia lemnae]